MRCYWCPCCTIVLQCVGIRLCIDVYVDIDVHACMDTDIDTDMGIDMDTDTDTCGLGDREVALHTVLLMAMMYNNIAMCGYRPRCRCICRYRCICMCGYWHRCWYGYRHGDRYRHIWIWRPRDRYVCGATHVHDVHDQQPPNIQRIHNPADQTTHRARKIPTDAAKRLAARESIESNDLWNTKHGENIRRPEKVQCSSALGGCASLCWCSLCTRPTMPEYTKNAFPNESSGP